VQRLEEFRKASWKRSVLSAWRIKGNSDKGSEEGNGYRESLNLLRQAECWQKCEQ
jgi:hypothetical protein